eukprot:scaffold6959_cov175-Skeletonema_dohrnii-CCMP3373.AAC.3
MSPAPNVYGILPPNHCTLPPALLTFSSSLGHEPKFFLQIAWRRLEDILQIRYTLNIQAQWILSEE